jgi:thiol:disulfide interchange protein DsbC
MSLMSKLFLTLLSLSSLLFANEAQVINFLKKGIGSNPNIVSLDIKVVSKMPLDKPKGWSAYIVQLTGQAKVRGKTQDISQRSIYFVGDGIVTAELYDLATGEKLNNTVSPDFSKEYYDAEHHLFGNKDAAHKVVIFSDPLCPFCRNYVPEALNYMKKYPKTFDVYYYHFPLASLHPAAIPLVKAAFVAEMQGRKGIVEGLYQVKVDGREPDLKKILSAFNTAQNTNITPQDLAAAKVNEHLKHDMRVAEEHLVNGTPTIFFDGKKDTTKNQYKHVKLIK